MKNPDNFIGIFDVENIVPNAFGRTDDLYHAMVASRMLAGPAELIPFVGD